MSEPQRSGLLKLLRESTGSQFVIPVYQRNYTWTAEKDVKQFLNDLENVVVGKYENHFLGILICLENTLTFSTRELFVIDGQQRLTTTFLTIYAMKELLKENVNVVQQLEEWYLTNRFCDDKLKYKLKPLVADDDVYRCIVDGKISQVDNKDSNVYKNYLYVKKYLADMLSKGYTADNVLTALDKLYVVYVPISKSDNPQKIFESINATGEKLTAADLIRNFLLMNLGSEEQEKYYRDYWRKIEINVSNDSKELEMFFRMYLAIKKYELVARSRVYREFVDWVEKSNIRIQELFEELLKYAVAYNYVIHDSLKACNERLEKALVDYRKIKSELPLAIIMEFTMLYFDRKIDENTLGDLIYSIDSYLIRRSICDLDSQNISRMFPPILKKIYVECAEDFKSILDVLNREMVGKNVNTSGSYMPTDQQMEDALYGASVYQRPALRIILDRLELNNNPAPVDLSKLSIEHLMPQTPTEEWLNELDTNEEIYFENLHRLGNLTLAAVKDNSVMKNLLWNFKNKVLEGTAHLKLTQEVLVKEKWNLECIEERTKNLIPRICDIYPYPNIENLAVVNDCEDSVSEKKAKEDAVKILMKKYNVEGIKNGMAYKTQDNREGFVIVSSKKYDAGDNEKYWYAYGDSKFNIIDECANKNLVLVCRSDRTVTLVIPKVDVDKFVENFNCSQTKDGKISHYHLVLYRAKDGKISLLLSKPDLRKIDISKYIVD